MSESLKNLSELSDAKLAELVKSGNTVFCLDYAQNGIGSNSCGQELLPQYRLDEEKMQFGFTIRFLSSENKQ